MMKNQDKKNTSTQEEIKNESIDTFLDTEDIEIVPNNDGQEDVKLKKVQKELQRCKKEKQEYLDGWQRTKADYVNALRRFEQDIKNAKDMGVQRSVKELLPALDSLQRARNPEGELPKGFDAIIKQLNTAFTALNVIKIQTQSGDIFNPEFHEALSRDVTKDKSKDNTISKVLEEGWKLNDMVIQPVKVSVAYHQQ